MPVEARIRQNCIRNIFGRFLFQSQRTSTVDEKSDLHCMSFEEVVAQPFTDEQQPSLQNKMRNNNIVVEVTIGDRESKSIELDPNKIAQGKYICVVVSCKDCMKPRCMYSITASNTMKPNHADEVSEPTIIPCMCYR
jgi:hypothetical protein